MGLASGKKEQDLAHSRQLWGSKGVREESRGIHLGVVEKCVALPTPPPHPNGGFQPRILEAENSLPVTAQLAVASPACSGASF